MSLLIKTITQEQTEREIRNKAGRQGKMKKSLHLFCRGQQCFEWLFNHFEMLSLLLGKNLRNLHQTATL
jgi:hypothetical protein